MNNSELWQAVLAELELTLSPSHFKTFFPHTQLLKIENNAVQIACPTAYSKNRLEQHHGHQIKNIIDRLTKNENTLAFVVKTAESKEVAPLPPLFAGTDRLERGIGLSPFYTFGNFVVGNNNNLANAVAQAVVERPGLSYNPFFLYSGVGLGKTHLVQAIGNEIVSKHAGLSVLYCTGESFTNELVDSIQSGSRRNTVKFRNKFRSIDILIIDDVHFIAGRETTQEEFFHTFNALYLAKKQIVLTSDRPPREIAKLEERLSSRFAGGIIADMQPPDVDMKTAILRHKAQSLGATVPDEVIDVLARSRATNVRELEGLFHQVIASAKTQNAPLNREFAEKTLGDANLPEKKAVITPQKIIQAVCAHYAVKPQDLRGERRLKEIVRPRQVAMYLLRTLTELPLAEIGELLGRRDHTTVLHGVEKIRKLVAENQPLREQVGVLREQVCG